jgi:hypothetical protein
MMKIFVIKWIRLNFYFLLFENKIFRKFNLVNHWKRIELKYFKSLYPKKLLNLFSTETLLSNLNCWRNLGLCFGLSPVGLAHLLLYLPQLYRISQFYCFLFIALHLLEKIFDFKYS